MFFIGVDVSSEFFDCCIARSDGDIVSRDRFGFSDDGFYSFIYHVGKNGVNSQNCLIGLQYPCSRLVDFLITRGYTVLPINSDDLARYEESTSPLKAEPHQAYAQIIADYIRHHQGVLRAIKIPDEKVRELKLLLEDRDRLIKEKLRLSKQLTNALKDYFPQVLDAFGDITSKPALEFLRRFDTFHQAKRSAADDTERFLDQCQCYRERDRDRLRNAMSKNSYHIPSEVVSAKVRLKGILVGHITLLTQEIENYEKSACWDGA